MQNVVLFLRQIVWGLPLISLLLGVSVYFSFRLHFVQVRHLKPAFRALLRSRKKSRDSTPLLGDVSNFASLCTALSATLGTGNIVGVAVALSLGGPGSLFWLVLSSFFGLATKYSEGILAIKYRRVGGDGTMAGGPMYYIEKGLKGKFWGRLFALLGALVALVGTGTLPQTHSIAVAVDSLGIPPGVTAVILVVTVALVICGGIHRIADVAEKVVPFMALLYLGAALVVLVLQSHALVPALRRIFFDAFHPQACLGGGLGAAWIHAIQTGVSRGIFCHEAGLGSAAIAAAAAQTESPLQQGQISMVGAFLSILVCIITGLVLMTTWGEAGLLGGEASATALAFGRGLGSLALGRSIVNLSIIFFAFTTIIGWSYYGEKCLQYVLGEQSLKIYRSFYLLFVLAGPFLHIQTIFIIADIVVGLMALPNVLSLIALRKEIIAETKDS